MSLRQEDESPFITVIDVRCSVIRISNALLRFFKIQQDQGKSFLLSFPSILVGDVGGANDLYSDLTEKIANPRPLRRASCMVTGAVTQDPGWSSATLPGGDSAELGPGDLCRPSLLRQLQGKLPLPRVFLGNTAPR